MDTNAILLQKGETFKKYADSWVALSPRTKKIIASARTPQKALGIAHPKGEPDPILTRIPKRFDSYVL